ncbi:GNAT family protein [Bacillus sp. DTU_2020_1000418_1_SI_GHA_SEK_038]|uniref:GNAT family N-acetyltransferase n=1 Tax=Bacillus sp. DTU_2020_1000418_1_SI_GHA_SEK_038 TaxID=3077585 RepID=UPI0028EFD7BD|nr:GNAT family protein [Bacillus sp. DTU_2020_1000418_1_SI_GHA_SEK_038]WNS73627.1 GNAT family protein [Bacillus sp. DTU_2020_1000418_1_SI_GHA_SEK_038]
MENINLENDIVLLREMNQNDVEGIYEASQDELIWKHMTLNIATKGDAVEFVEIALSLKEQGTEYPFVIIDQKTKEIIGSTRFLDLHLEHKRLEIGYTWLNPKYWRTSINTNCKYLLLEYCFEKLNLHRVQLKTDHENFRSQKAIERIGGKKEGILRNHMIRQDGTARHTVMYSITHEEWPSVKEHLQQLLE